MEEAVRQAFRDRPHFVDQAPGFLSMEVLAKQDDPSFFWLSTWWADLRSYQAWHSSEAHAASHRGIPKGLRLDATYTKLIFLREAVQSPESVAGAESDDACTELFREYLRSSSVVHLLVADIGGGIQQCNSRMAELLGVPGEHLRGRTIWSYLT